MKKLIDKDPFSNGTEHLAFETYNCDKCIKSSVLKKDQISYTNADENNMPKCSIQRDIVTRMFNNEPINQRTVDVCYDFIMHGIICPYRKTERKKYIKKDKQQTELEL